MSKTVTFTLLLPQELKIAVLAKAKAEDTSLSRIIRVFLKAWLGEQCPHVYEFVEGGLNESRGT